MIKTKQIIGSVSHGTMREEDLIPVFIDTVAYFNKNRARELQKELDEINKTEDDEDRFEQIGYFLNETLFDVLNEYAPPYFYFGASEGDGSDYGFWLSSCALDDFDGLKVNDLSEIPKGYVGEVLLVNDHGNTSLYWQGKRKLKEIWAIV